MATTSFDSVWTLGATRIAVPAGATVALFCQPQQGQLGWYLKFIGGGTCEILSTGIGTTSSPGYFYGTTQSAAALVTLTGNGYFLGPIGGTVGFYETVKIPGPASFYLASTGSTSVVSALLLKGQGY